MASGEIANLRNILIIYNRDDGIDWKDYLKAEIGNYFTEKISIKYVQDRRVPPTLVERKPSGPDITKINLAPIKRPAIMLVLCTPKHLQYLKANPLISYKQALAANLTFHPENSIIYFCNTFQEELEETDAAGVRLRDRFEEFFKWYQFDCNGKTIELAKFMESVFFKITKEIASKIHPKAKLINTTAKCQEPATMAVVFEKALPENAIVQTYLDLHSIPTEILNPYTITFLTCEHIEGEANVLITVNGNEVNLDQQIISFVSPAQDINIVSQIYITLMNKVIEVALTNGTSRSMLDCELMKVFSIESDTTPVQAFEMLFGVFQATSDDTSDYQFPSLLHLAAHHGLKEFTGRLMDLPDNKLVLGLPNNKNKIPMDLAREQNHEELASYLENMEETHSNAYLKYNLPIFQGLNDVYMEIVKNFYVNGKLQDTNKNMPVSSTPGYLSMNKADASKGKSKNRTSSSNPSISKILNDCLEKGSKNENDLVHTINQCDESVIRSQGHFKCFQERHEMSKRVNSEVTKVINNIEVSVQKNLLAGYVITMDTSNR
ncbi:hypothetical protein HELRODRAFT_163326 [Helobdella robusta]|uniref:DBB domain-containing protein n=1 Tax=Helobdella robusta TaxID=6412 RepID=T1ETX0_HELRO|nr:hypothetical protein HELRODRAFT_163326 [Helobdella robusta]ESN96279.1 hypothetical protein HELRODRAFT_163326 [Helobdella robusta]